MLSWDESSIYHAERKVTAVRFSKWHIAPEKPEAQACLRAAGYPYLVAAVLSARGIETPEQAAAFLEREDKLTISPFLMRDMDKAAARVQQAIANGERIAVFGDYDVDGIRHLHSGRLSQEPGRRRGALHSPAHRGRLRSQP